VRLKIYFKFPTALNPHFPLDMCGWAHMAWGARVCSLEVSVLTMSVTALKSHAERSPLKANARWNTAERQKQRHIIPTLIMRAWKHAPQTIHASTNVTPAPLSHTLPTACGTLPTPRFANRHLRAK
jgi:hypothetical protein